MKRTMYKAKISVRNIRTAVNKIRAWWGRVRFKRMKGG